MHENNQTCKKNIKILVILHFFKEQNYEKEILYVRTNIIHVYHIYNITNLVRLLMLR